MIEIATLNEQPADKAEPADLPAAEQADQDVSKKRPSRRKAAAAKASIPADNEAEKPVRRRAPSKAVMADDVQPEAPKSRGRRTTAVKKADPVPVVEAVAETAIETTVEESAPRGKRRVSRGKAAPLTAQESTAVEPVEDTPVPVAQPAPETAAAVTEDATSVRLRRPRRPARHSARSATAHASVSNEAQADSSLAEEAAETLQPAPTEDTVQAVAPEEVDDRPLFADLGLSEPVQRAITEMGYLHPTPIQAQAIPVVLMGRDVLGCAQTGTGKTASFTLPMMDILSDRRARARMPRSLILEPTRELALQVAENFVKYGQYLKLNHALLIGGESMNDQRDVLSKGVDVLIATPGRLIDLFDRGGLLLTDTRILVIDEADRMLDMGFIPDVERIVSLLPHNRQTLFFSATMAPEIRRLADAFLQNPKEITVAKPASVATTITSGLALVGEMDKRKALRHLLRQEKVQNALIFCNRKRDVDILTKSLVKHGFAAGPLHGDLAQSLRFSTLEKFKAGSLQLLVCSDVAARGIDIGGLSHVFNFDVPIHAEDYVHRIGRTGRAGREGAAFTLASPDDKFAVDAIEKLINAPIPRIEIEGLERAEWSEEPNRGRGRRHKNGKGGKGNNRYGSRGQDSARKDRAFTEADAKSQADITPDPVAEVATTQPAPAPAQPTQSQDRRHRSRNDEHGRQKHSGGHNQPHAPGSASSNAAVEDRRPQSGRDRRRDDDLGPSVRGFGDDVPAFMLLPRRIAKDIRTEDTADPADGLS
ncbi:ATP-dependent RNA helicase [Granulibacter bethesdensis]|uniref:DEAD-box ATP-dependent RNA helicase RhpA n=1 Tax=Granulibacter bethesdensis TaxID=364410 RepID=A0AAN0RDU6_9PROT|nr:ATP-dependent RNA helicase [Granulibacter bethesdensis]